MGLGLRTLLPIVLAAGLFARVQSCGNSCPTYWTRYNGSCYRLFGEPVTWPEARRLCRTLGSELVSVNSAGENAFLYNYWKSGTKTDCIKWGFWLGVNDIDKEGKYVNADGTDVEFFNWEKNEPNQYKGNEDCVHVRYRKTESDPKMGWNDLDCNGKHGNVPYICELNPGC